MQLLARLTTGFPFHPFLKQLLSKGNNSLLLLPHCKTEKNTAATLQAFREKKFHFLFSKSHQTKFSNGQITTDQVYWTPFQQYKSTMLSAGHQWDSDQQQMSALNTHALYSIRKMRNIWETAVRYTSYTLGKEIISKERQEAFSTGMTD